MKKLIILLWILVLLLPACEKFEKKKPNQTDAFNTVTSPIQVSNIQGKALKISAGVGFTCAIVKDQTNNQNAFCWGKNTNGQLGTGSEEHYQSVPAKVLFKNTDGKISPLEEVKAVATANEYACAIYGKDNHVACWGSASHKKLGQAYEKLLTIDPKTQIVNKGFSNVALEIYEDKDTVLTQIKPEQLYAGHDRICVVKGLEQVPYCWGNIRRIEKKIEIDSKGVTKTIPTVIQEDNVIFPKEISTVVDLQDSVENWSDVQHNGLAILSNDTCIISNENLKCLQQKVQMKALLLSANKTGACFLRKTHASHRSKTVSCWTEGEKPKDAFELKDYVLQLTSLHNHSCALLKDSTAYCWGNNEFGQLGNGEQSDEDQGLTKVKDLLPALEISAGATHTCAISQSDGSIWCWGGNGFGQLGPQGPTPDLGY